MTGVRSDPRQGREEHAATARPHAELRQVLPQRISQRRVLIEPLFPFVMHIFSAERRATHCTCHAVSFCHRASVSNGRDRHIDLVLGSADSADPYHE